MSTLSFARLLRSSTPMASSKLYCPLITRRDHRLLTLSRYHFCNDKPPPSKRKSKSKSKSAAGHDRDHNREHVSPQPKPQLQYSRLQLWLKRFASVLYVAVGIGTLCGLYLFREHWVKPRQQVAKPLKYSVPIKQREHMMRAMANKFQSDLQFVTADNEQMNGMDILQRYPNRFFVLYFGYVDCADQCPQILRLIQQSLNNAKKLAKYKTASLSILYIDLNIFDTALKLRSFLSTHVGEYDGEVLGLIPKDRETLKELMESFMVYVEKHDNGDQQTLRLHHSNMLYFIDSDGLLYDVLGGSDQLSADTIADAAYRLVTYSEATWRGKINNTLSLMFRSSPITEFREANDKRRKEIVVD